MTFVLGLAILLLLDRTSLAFLSLCVHLLRTHLLREFFSKGYQKAFELFGVNLLNPMEHRC